MKKRSITIPISRFNMIIDQLEDLQDVLSFYKYKSKPDDQKVFIPVEELWFPTDNCHERCRYFEICKDKCEIVK